MEHQIGVYRSVIRSFVQLEVPHNSVRVESEQELVKRKLIGKMKEKGLTQDYMKNVQLDFLGISKPLFTINEPRRFNVYKNIN